MASPKEWIEMTIEIRDLKSCKAETFDQLAAGESATIISTGAVIHPEFATVFPLWSTVVRALVSIQDTRVYKMTVRVYDRAVHRSDRRFRRGGLRSGEPSG